MPTVTNSSSSTVYAASVGHALAPGESAEVDEAAAADFADNPYLTVTPGPAPATASEPAPVAPVPTEPAPAPTAPTEPAPVAPDTIPPVTSEA